MLAIINARIITMEERDYENGTILLQDGKILEVGEGIILPEGIEIIDANGKYVLPGFIDAHTHLGIVEEIYRVEGDDANEITDPITPQLRAIDAVNSHDIAFQDALRGGVTTVMIAPGSANVIGGLTTVFKVWGKSFSDMIMVEEAGLKIALGENPKRVYGEQKKMPYTRMATAALLRQAFIDAENYRKKKIKERSLKMENLVKVLEGSFPLRAHAHRADDILTVLRIASEFKLNIVVEHCTEGHKIIKELIEAEAAVVIGPSLINRAKVELKEKSFKTSALLTEAGINVALITDHPETSVEYLVLCAALAVKEGMQEREALKAITINPAKILGLESRIGSIKKGKDADLVIWTGFPLDIRNRPERVFINGIEAYVK